MPRDIHEIIPPRCAALAPMAGASDLAMRELCADFGAAYTVCEMVSAKALTMGDKKSLALAKRGNCRAPFGAQLFGDDPGIMAEAARRLASLDIDFIDINMGCPVPKVAGNGSGAALMKNPARARDIAAAVVRAVKLPVTVKMRAGWDEDHLSAPELAKMLEDAGVSAIALHARTRAQMYAPPVRLDWLRAVKEAVCVPVVGNGDIATPQDAARMLEETGCAAVMVGRASRGAPWIFQHIRAYLEQGVLLPEPPVAFRMRCLLRQARRAIEDKGEYAALREARSYAAHYMRGLPGAARLRAACSALCTLRDLERLAYEVCKNAE